MQYRIKVTAIPEKGFRRAGIFFTREETIVTVSEDQLKLIQGEPLLVCQVLEEIPESVEVVKLNAADTIKLVSTASAEDLAKLAEGEERKSVMDAIAKRQTELAKTE